MKCTKYFSIALLMLIATSLMFASCSKRSVPRKHYSGMAPRAPRK